MDRGQPQFPIRPFRILREAHPVDGVFAGEIMRKIIRPITAGSPVHHQQAILRNVHAIWVHAARIREDANRITMHRAAERPHMMRLMAGMPGKCPGRPLMHEEPPQNRKKKKHTVGKVLAMIQGVLSIIALALLMFLDAIPTQYVIIGAVLLVILWVFAFFSQFTRGTHIVGKIESVILCIVLAMGSYSFIYYEQLPWLHYRRLCEGR